MSQEPQGETTLSASLPGGLPLPPKQGGYSLKDILALHDQALLGITPAAEPDPVEEASSSEIIVEWAMPAAPLSEPPIPLSERVAPPPPASPWAAIPLPTLELGSPERAADTEPSLVHRLPMIDPTAFAAMPIDSLAEMTDDEPATPNDEPLPLARLQRSLATLNELEAQLDQLMSEAGASTVPDANEWLGALADLRPDPDPQPSVAVAPAWPAELAESVEAAMRRPAEAASLGTASPTPPAVDTAQPAASTASREFDLATPEGIAASQAELTASLAEAGRLLTALTDHQRAKQDVDALMAKVQSGTLEVDEVIAVGQALGEARLCLQQTIVDRQQLADLIVRLQQDRELLDQYIERLKRY